MSDEKRKPGSYAAQQYLAKQERFDALVKGFDEPYPELARHYIAVMAVLHRSAVIAKFTRSADPISPDAFIAQFVRLESYLAWLAEASDDALLSELWPKDAGCTFALKAGASAMGAILTFANSVHDACVIARAFERTPSGDRFWEDQPVHPVASPAIASWAKLAMEELRSRIIPPDHVWPVMGHIHRDHSVMTHKLQDEYMRARARANERRPDLTLLARRVASRADQYAALRKRLFDEVLAFKQTHSGWKIQYTRDPAEGDPSVPPRPVHQTGTMNSIGGIEFDGIATFEYCENYAPFTKLTLFDPEHPERHLTAETLSVRLRLGFVLDRLLDVVAELARDTDLLQRNLTASAPDFDSAEITRFQLALPVFPYWPQIKGMTAEKYQQILDEERPTLDAAKVALRRVELLQSASSAQRSEAMTPYAAYERCLRIVFDSGYRMEALPSTFEGKGEEALRDHFVTVLSSHFQSVTGETFNKAGKTDIFVRHDGALVLVGECKFWSGPKNFGETIDQVLSYLSWRDDRAVVIMFVRNRELTPVLHAAREATRAHSCFVSEREAVNEAWINCTFRMPSDQTRSLRLAIMCFHFPAA